MVHKRKGTFYCKPTTTRRAQWVFSGDLQTLPKMCSALQLSRWFSSCVVVEAWSALHYQEEELVGIGVVMLFARGIRSGMIGHALQGILLFVSNHSRCALTRLDGGEKSTHQAEEQTTQLGRQMVLAPTSDNDAEPRVSKGLENT